MRPGPLLVPGTSPDACPGLAGHVLHPEVAPLGAVAGIDRRVAAADHLEVEAAAIGASEDLGNQAAVPVPGAVLGAGALGPTIRGGWER